MAVFTPSGVVIKYIDSCKVRDWFPGFQCWCVSVQVYPADFFPAVLDGIFVSVCSWETTLSITCLLVSPLWVFYFTL